MSLSPTSNPSFTIRHALVSDIPQLVTLDRLVNHSHPIVALMCYDPSLTASEAEERARRTFASRYEWILSHQTQTQRPARSTLYCAIDVASGDVVGVLLGMKPKSLLMSGTGTEPDEEEGDKVAENSSEWQPTPPFPNTSFWEYFRPLIDSDTKKFPTEQMWELQSMFVHPSHQRRGIGKGLVRRWLEECVDVDGWRNVSTSMQEEMLDFVKGRQRRGVEQGQGGKSRIRTSKQHGERIV